MSSLLSHCAFFLRSRLVLSDHVDAGGTKLFPQSFTIRELKDALHSYISISRRTSSVPSALLIEAMITSLELQMFFYNASWKSMERATDDDICILLRCDAYEHQLQPARSKLSSSPVPRVLVSATALDSDSTNIPISTAASSSSMIEEGSDTGCLPIGVMSSLSRCYSSTCDESYPCYSFSCPNRPKRKTFTVQCYSNSCSSGYGCYSPTCPCRYGTDAEVVPEEIEADISIEAGNVERIPSPAGDPHTGVMPGYPTPKSTPKLSLNTTGPLFYNGQNGFFYSPFVSPATTISTNSFSSSMTPSSPYSSLSPISPFSPAAWAASSPINVDSDSDADFDFSRSPIAQNLPRIYTHFSHFNSYQDSNLSPYSNPRSAHYASSPVSTPLSPNWEPLLLISMIGPSVAWVSRERSPLSATPPTTYDDNPQSNQSLTSPSYSYSIPFTNRPFSSILKSYMADDQTDNTRNEPSETELASPMTPYSLTFNSGPVTVSHSSH